MGSDYKASAAAPIRSGCDLSPARYRPCSLPRSPLAGWDSGIRPRILSGSFRCAGSGFSRRNGSRVEMGPGDIHFGQDTDTAEIDGKTGHLSGTIGDEPCLQVLIQFASSPAAPTPHPFG